MTLPERFSSTEAHRSCASHQLSRLLTLATLASAALCCLFAPPAVGQDLAGIGKVFRPLKPGHKVSLVDLSGGIEIQLLNDGAIGTYTVVEVGTAHLVLQDISGLTRRWRPVTAVRAVVWTRLPTAGGQPGAAWRDYLWFHRVHRRSARRGGGGATCVAATVACGSGARVRTGAGIHAEKVSLG